MAQESIDRMININGRIRVSAGVRIEEMIRTNAETLAHVELLN